MLRVFVCLVVFVGFSTLMAIVDARHPERLQRRGTFLLDGKRHERHRGPPSASPKRGREPQAYRVENGVDLLQKLRLGGGH
jgi:hypothetical protein